MKSVLVVVGLVGSLTFAGCSTESGGDQLCSKVQTCAEKSGAAFSQSQCKDDLQQAQEEADTAGCGDEYASYMDCVGALDFQCSDDLSAMITAECGAKVKAVAKCTGGGVAFGQSACAAARERMDAKYDSCGISRDPASNDEECTEEWGIAYAKVADCTEQASCSTLDLTDADGDADARNEYSKCLGAALH